MAVTMKLNGRELVFEGPEDAAAFMAAYDVAISKGATRGGTALEGQEVPIHEPPTPSMATYAFTPAPKANGDASAQVRKKPGFAIVKSNSPREAMKKLLKTLTFNVHKTGLTFLAGRGAAGANFDELREALGIPEGRRINSFTSSITRRCSGFGLASDDVLAIETVGSVGGHRVMKYTLGPTMIEVVNEEFGLEKAS